MTTGSAALEGLEQDALTELVNIGVSRAAASLRKMVGQHILLSVPSVEVVSRKTATTLIGERESDDLVSVSQDFFGAMSGRALLIFPLANSLELVRTVVGESVSDEELAALEQDTLAEIGNVILNGCLATMANMLQQSLDIRLPEVRRGPGRELFEMIGPGDDGLVLFLYINFSVRERDLRGYIAMLMDLASIDSLKQLIREFIARVMCDEPAAVVDASRATGMPRP